MATTGDLPSGWFSGDEPRATVRGRDSGGSVSPLRRLEQALSKGGDPVTNLYDCIRGLHV